MKIKWVVLADEEPRETGGPFWVWRHGWTPMLVIYYIKETQEFYLRINNTGDALYYNDVTHWAYADWPPTPNEQQ